MQRKTVDLVPSQLGSPMPENTDSEDDSDASSDRPSRDGNTRHRAELLDFLTRETKMPDLLKFEELLVAIRELHERDFERDENLSPASDGARLPIGKGYIDGVYALAPQERARIVPRWPLLTRSKSEEGSDERDSTALRRGSFDVREHAERHARRVDGSCAGDTSFALGYSRMELVTLGNVEKRRAFGDVYKEPSACVRHLCIPGRIWEGKIAIPGTTSMNEVDGQTPYALQVMWFDAAAGTFLISHTAHGDEQLCHLTLDDDGSTGKMGLSFSDNETYCTGSIDGQTGVISGTVGQLVRADEGFFEPSDAAQNTFTLAPIDFDVRNVDTHIKTDDEVQELRVYERRKLIAQWSRSPNVLAATYEAVEFLRENIKSEHMSSYLLRRIARETPLIDLAKSKYDTASPLSIEPESLLQNDEGCETLLRLRQESQHRLGLWMSFPEIEKPLTVTEDMWRNMWFIEQLNAELLSCKFRLYTRLLRARVFQSMKEKTQYLSEFDNLRSECHASMNRVLNNMNVLLWRIFYGGETTKGTTAIYSRYMYTSMRVKEHRMAVAYGGVDRALRECDARLPLESIQRLVRVAGDDAYMCSICLLEVGAGEESLGLECGHNFHPACCSQWLHTHATCPNCRKVLNP